jgi:hypothetical protein
MTRSCSIEEHSKWLRCHPLRAIFEEDLLLDDLGNQALAPGVIRTHDLLIRSSPLKAPDCSQSLSDSDTYPTFGSRGLQISGKAETAFARASVPTCV